MVPALTRSEPDPGRRAAPKNEPASRQRMLIHMMEECARHHGHADLQRVQRDEAVDA
jgi:hypothetical protein